MKPTLTLLTDELLATERKLASPDIWLQGYSYSVSNGRGMKETVKRTKEDMIKYYTEVRDDLKRSIKLIENESNNS